MTDPHQTPQPSASEPVSQQRANDKKRKIMIGVLIACAVIVVLSLLSTMIDPAALVKRLFGEEPDAPQDIFFYGIDDPYNYLDNEAYLDMDRRLFYENPATGEGYTIDPEALASEGREIQFFYHYFEAVKNADLAALRQMHTADYKDLPEEMTVQMIYDIFLTPLTEDGTVVGYRVDYKIYRNNGTFRDDMGSDTVRPMVYHLIEEDGKLKIDAIIPYTSYIRR